MIYINVIFSFMIIIYFTNFVSIVPPAGLGPKFPPLNVIVRTNQCVFQNLLAISQFTVFYSHF